MQNRYAGDIGDFGKFLLLKLLKSKNIKLGINWYLVLKEEQNKDGKKTEYLKNSKYTQADEALASQLSKIVNSENRGVKLIEDSNVLPEGTIYYSEETKQGKELRENWFKQSLTELKNADLIFLDPDNGMEVKSCPSKGRKKSIKYVFCDEVKEYYKNGKSILIYQHATREKLEEHKNGWAERFIKDLKLNKDQLITIKGNSHYYILIMQQKHQNALTNSIKKLENSQIAPEILRIFE